jgi:glutaredoxin 2
MCICMCFMHVCKNAIYEYVFTYKHIYVNNHVIHIGKKMAPILQFYQEDKVMGESLDIIEYMDKNPAFGPVNTFKPITGRTDILAWQKKVKDTHSRFSRPRYMMTILPEFQQIDGKNAFINNHPLAPYEKPHWKANMNIDEKWKVYENGYKESLGLMQELNDSLTELDKMVFCTEFCSEGGLSIDDIDLFSRLRSISLTKGVVWPEKLRKYMDYFAAAGDVPMYDSMAC